MVVAVVVAAVVLAVVAVAAAKGRGGVCSYGCCCCCGCYSYCLFLLLTKQNKSPRKYGIYPPGFQSTPGLHYIFSRESHGIPINNLGFTKTSFSPGTRGRFAAKAAEACGVVRRRGTCHCKDVE